MTDPLVRSIRADVEYLCGLGSRDLGTPQNRDATTFALRRMREIALQTEALEFEVPEWRYGTAAVRAGGIELPANPGPFSRALDGAGPLVVARSAADLDGLDARGAVLLLCGEIAASQFTPRGYPFYGNPEHAAILDAIEALEPLAVLAATGKHPMTGAMSPFPLIEEVGFIPPSAYLSARAGESLALHAGETISVRIESEVLPSRSVQPVGHRAGGSRNRILLCAHIDSKPWTPGALDNATGVATLFAAVGLLGDTPRGHALEVVPFNGEDHVLAPGELAWLAENPDLSDIRLVVNIDAVGLPGADSACSTYGLDEETALLVARLVADSALVSDGPQWPASDHMIFAMRGIPTVALTTADFSRGADQLFHTPADTPDVVDYALVAGAARFVADLISAL